MGIELRVHPTLIPKKRLIANVNGVMNAILVKGDAVGPTLYYGAGAGSEPTASSVIADIIDVARTLTADPEHKVPYLSYQQGELNNDPILPIEETVSAHYLRMTVDDKPGVMNEITKIFAAAGISIEAIIQKEQEEEDETTVPLILVTSRVVEKQLNLVVAEIEALSFVCGKVTRIRVESLAG